MTIDVVAIIPARGGSRRVPDKNVRTLSGKPLLAYTIAAAQDAGLDEVYVSTDCERIAKVGLELGAHLIERPPLLAEDTASTEGVLLHALDHLALQDRFPSWVMTLPPTSPLRKAGTIRAAVEQVERAPHVQDCLYTVHECREDFWVGDPATGLKRLFPEAPRRQQDREPLWVENSALYLTQVQALRETGFILGRKPRALPITAVEGTDINVETDFQVAEVLLTVGDA